MSDTPRTDKLAARFTDGETEHPHALAFCNLCRNLERELAQMTAERDSLIQTSGELCPLCGWRMKFPNEPCRCEVIQERDALEAAAKKVLFYASPYELGKNLEDALNKLNKLASRKVEK